MPIALDDDDGIVVEQLRIACAQNDVPAKLAIELLLGFDRRGD